MATIQKLPDLLVNKIAAGEVVERPASVVKELLENSLDAGATTITLSIEDGGRKLIRVQDDGEGIPLDQLDRAILPHATSKLQSEEDLYHIHTMGFRGEALASIGAVSHLKITSRTANSTEGGEIYVAGEKIQSRGASGCPLGTIIEVRDLFFNVPARRKFLRGSSTEFGHIQEQLSRIALPNPQVAFELVHNGRTIKHLQRCSGMMQRINSFYGEELVHDLIPIERQERGLRISGLVAKPAHTRASSKWQYVFLNGRYIRDRYVQHAVKEAYRGLMEPSRFPVVFIAITIDPASVDVNVHPTKIEVRWEDSNMIHSQVLSCLRETFLRQDLTPVLSARKAIDPPTAQQRMEERQRIAEFFKQVKPSVQAREPSTGALSPPQENDSPSISMSELAIKYQARADEPAVEPQLSADLQATPAPVIQLHRTYLVTETDEGMLIIDQHALHERIIYEELKRRIACGTLESQRLLIAETITLTPAQIATLTAREDLLKQIGIDITLYGEDTVAVQSFPTILHSASIAEFMKDLVDRLAEKGNQPHTEVLIHELLDMMACKAAVKAGDPLSQEEIRGLLDSRELVDRSSNCPHGRPTTLRFSLADLAHQFKRT